MLIAGTVNDVMLRAAAILQMGHNQANMMSRQGMGKSSNVTDGTQSGQHDEQTRDG